MGPPDGVHTTALGVLFPGPSFDGATHPITMVADPEFNFKLSTIAFDDSIYDGNFCLQSNVASGASHFEVLFSKGLQLIS